MSCGGAARGIGGGGCGWARGGGGGGGRGARGLTPRGRRRGGRGARRHHATALGRRVGWANSAVLRLLGGGRRWGRRGGQAAGFDLRPLGLGGLEGAVDLSQTLQGVVDLTPPGAQPLV